MYSPSIVRSRPLEEVVTVNELALVAVPPGVVTETVPVVAPAGTLVEMWLASVTEKVAAVPLNFTLVEPVKFVPVKVTLVPTTPLVGEKFVRVGLATLTVKLVAEVAVPCGVINEIFPVTAPLGTVKVALVALLTEKVAETPPTVTEVAPVRFVPVSVTEVPTAPLVGLKLEMVGDKFGGGGGAWLTLPLPQPTMIASTHAKQTSADTKRNLIADCLFDGNNPFRNALAIASNLVASSQIHRFGCGRREKDSSLARTSPPALMASFGAVVLSFNWDRALAGDCLLDRTVQVHHRGRAKQHARQNQGNNAGDKPMRSSRGPGLIYTGVKGCR